MNNNENLNNALNNYICAGVVTDRKTNLLNALKQGKVSMIGLVLVNKVTGNKQTGIFKGLQDMAVKGVLGGVEGLDKLLTSDNYPMAELVNTPKGPRMGKIMRDNYTIVQCIYTQSTHYYILVNAYGNSLVVPAKYVWKTVREYNSSDKEHFVYIGEGKRLAGKIINLDYRKCAGINLKPYIRVHEVRANINPEAFENANKNIKITNKSPNQQGYVVRSHMDFDRLKNNRT